MFNPYDWDKTLSYNAPITMVCTIRDRGKTFGLRVRAWNDWLKDGKRFVEICRHQKEIPGVMRGYFEKIQREKNPITGKPYIPSGYMFKYEKNAAFVAVRGEDGQPGKWEQIGYFVALTAESDLKKHTFVNVRKMIFDEAVIDKTRNKYAEYLPFEWQTLTNIVDTVLRQAPGTETEGKLYLLGNAVDLMNPYFIHMGITDEPSYGYSWHNNKLMLLHYEQPTEEIKKAKADTFAGKMAAGTKEGTIITENKFANTNKEFIAKKTPASKFSFGIVFKDVSYGIWLDHSEGYFYVTSSIPNNTNKPIYSLSMNDNRINYIAAKKATKPLQAFVELYYMGIVRYENLGVYEQFTSVLRLFGIQ